MAIASIPGQFDYYGFPLVVVPNGTAWWAGDRTHYIDWSRDLRKDAIEVYKETWSWHGFDIMKAHDRDVERKLTR